MQSETSCTSLEQLTLHKKHACLTWFLAQVFSRSFLHRTECSSILCKKPACVWPNMRGLLGQLWLLWKFLVQELALTCTKIWYNKLVQKSCTNSRTSFLTVCHQHYSRLGWVSQQFTFGNCCNRTFYRLFPFLSPSQPCQSTESKDSKIGNGNTNCWLPTIHHNVLTKSDDDRRMLRAARSRCRKRLLSRYAMPDTICRARSHRVVTK